MSWLSNDKCPQCNGKGWTWQRYYSSEGAGWGSPRTTQTYKETCEACGGTGKEKDVPQSYYKPPNSGNGYNTTGG